MATIDWTAVFDDALPYTKFLDKYATPSQRDRWDASHARFALDADQSTLLAGFTRKLPVLCMAGAWCGDCMNQCPIFDHFASASKVIDLKFIDRDARPDVGDALAINGGHRVPNVLFLSEDFHEVSRYGERTLVGYRKLAEDQLGASCPTGFVAPDESLTKAVAAEWLGQFERAQLILRLSVRLRAKYQD